MTPFGRRGGSQLTSAADDDVTTTPTAAGSSGTAAHTHKQSQIHPAQHGRGQRPDEADSTASVYNESEFLLGIKIPTPSAAGKYRAVVIVHYLNEHDLENLSPRHTHTSITDRDTDSPTGECS